MVLSRKLAPGDASALGRRSPARRGPARASAHAAPRAWLGRGGPARSSPAQPSLPRRLARRYDSDSISEQSVLPCVTCYIACKRVRAASPIWIRDSYVRIS